MTGHVLPTRAYYVVFATLLALTLITTEAASMDLGPFNVVVALVIAGIKSVLVVLFFMHVRYSKPLIWLAAGAALIWLGIMIGLTLSDYLSRGWFPAPAGL